MLKSGDGVDVKIGDHEAEQRFGKKIQDLSDEELKLLIASNPRLAEFVQKPNYEKVWMRPRRKRKVSPEISTRTRIRVISSIMLMFFDLKDRVEIQ